MTATILSVPHSPILWNAHLGTEIISKKGINVCVLFIGEKALQERNQAYNEEYTLKVSHNHATQAV